MWSKRDISKIKLDLLRIKTHLKLHTSFSHRCVQSHSYSEFKLAKSSASLIRHCDQSNRQHSMHNSNFITFYQHQSNINTKIWNHPEKNSKSLPVANVGHERITDTHNHSQWAMPWRWCSPSLRIHCVASFISDTWKRVFSRLQTFAKRAICYEHLFLSYCRSFLKIEKRYIAWQRSNSLQTTVATKISAKHV